MPFRIMSILVASDLSETARPIVRTAAALAALTEAELHVVHAAEPQGIGLEGRAQEQERLRTADAALQEQLRTTLPPTAVVTSHHAAAGRAHEIVLARAAEVQADLIVIGPHRERPVGDMVLGTTADRLVRTSEVPCLIAHAALSLPLRRVLVPSDLSDAAQGALDVALVWGTALRQPTASGKETRLYVLHVLPPVPDATPTEYERTRAERELQARVGTAHDRMGGVSPLQVTETVIYGGEPADEILGFAREERVDLLVMGTHGHSGLARALIGSVSSAVARRAGCPVLLVPPVFWKARQASEEGRQRG